MIRLRNVRKTFGSFTAVDDLSLEVEAGETLVLLGTSGSGKTTLLKMINRLIELSAGTIEVAGTDIRQQKPAELRRRIGYVIQGAGLFPHYTVRENIAVVPRLLGWDQHQTAKQTEQLLTMVGLAPETYLDKHPEQLSGGEQQRVGLARALVADPPVVLMDEPFGALDPITRTRIRQEFTHLEALRHKTIVLVTHDVQEAFELGGRICLLDQGRLQQIGSPQDLLFRPANDFVRNFLEDQRFQLQLQALTLQDLRPNLLSLSPTVAAPSVPLPETATVQEAIQVLASRPQGQKTICLAEPAAPPVRAGFAELMTAVEQTLHTLQR